MLSQIAKLVSSFLNSLSLARRVRPYRPEKYYMRGPGPQWRAKHDRPFQ